MLRPTIANEPDRGRRRELEHPRALTEEHLTPIALERIDASARGRARARCADVRRALPRPLRLRPRRAGRAVPRAPRLDRAPVRTMDRRLAPEVGVGLDEAEYHDVVHRSPRASGWDAGFPGERMLPALRRDARPTSASASTSSGTSTSTSSRGRRSRHAFCSPIEVPARVVLVIQPVGGPDDWHALFHEAGHTSTSEHVAVAARRGAQARRRRGHRGLGGALRQPRRRPGLALAAVDFPAARLRGGVRGSSTSSSSRAATRRSCSTSSSCTRRTTPTGLRPRYVELLGDAVKVDPAAADYLATSTRLRPAPAICALGRSRRSCGTSSGSGLGEGWFARREPARCSASCGSSASPTADELLRDVTGAGLEMAAVEERIRADLA